MAAFCCPFPSIHNLPVANVLSWPLNDFNKWQLGGSYDSLSMRMFPIGTLRALAMDHVTV